METQPNESLKLGKIKVDTGTWEYFLLRSPLGWCWCFYKVCNSLHPEMQRLLVSPGSLWSGMAISSPFHSF